MSLILNGTDGLSDVDGTAATPAIRGTDANTGIFFPAADTIAFSEGGVESMRLDASGNVGIGTSSPTDKLTIAHADEKGITFKATGADGTTAAQLLFEDTNGGTGGVFRFDHAVNSFTFDTAGTTERMRINSSGNLLVDCTASPNGTNRRGFEIQANAGAGDATKMLIATTTTATRALIEFNNGNGNVGSIAVSGSSTSYSTSSDYRLKENIAPMTGALNIVQQLKPVTYNWKVDGSSSQGFIAHELQAVVPDCVQGEKDAVDAEGKPVHQGIDTSFLVATLTAAIQEQQALITQLQADVAALKVQP